MKSIFITGTSRGLGKAIAKVFLEKNYNVIGLSRNSSSLQKEYSDHYFHIFCDLYQIENIKNILKEFFSNSILKSNEIEILILNSGILGNIKEMHKTSMEEIETVMKVNVWSNKILLDTLFELEQEGKVQNLKYVLAISSGASIKGDKGWSAYALSKAALNMLIKIYSNEFPEKKMISLAPGLVLTAMQEEIYNLNIDLEKFPSFKRLIDARKNQQMPTADEVAIKIYENWDKIFSFESGSYIDLRNL